MDIRAAAGASQRHPHRLEASEPAISGLSRILPGARGNVDRLRDPARPLIENDPPFLRAIAFRDVPLFVRKEGKACHQMLAALNCVGRNWTGSPNGPPRRQGDGTWRTGRIARAA